MRLVQTLTILIKTFLPSYGHSTRYEWEQSKLLKCIVMIQSTPLCNLITSWCDQFFKNLPNLESNFKPYIGDVIDLKRGSQMLWLCKINSTNTLDLKNKLNAYFFFWKLVQRIFWLCKINLGDTEDLKKSVWQLLWIYKTISIHTIHWILRFQRVHINRLDDLP